MQAIRISNGKVKICIQAFLGFNIDIPGFAKYNYNMAIYFINGYFAL